MLDTILRVLLRIRIHTEKTSCFVRFCRIPSTFWLSFAATPGYYTSNRNGIIIVASRLSDWVQTLSCIKDAIKRNQINTRRKKRSRLATTKAHDLMLNRPCIPGNIHSLLGWP